MNPVFRAVIHNRLREPSTYVGLILIIAGALGYQLNDETAAEIAGGFAVIVGAILTWHRERKSADHASRLSSNRPAPPPFTDVDPPPGSRARPPQGGARERFTSRLKDEHEDGGP